MGNLGALQESQQTDGIHTWTVETSLPAFCLSLYSPQTNWLLKRRAKT